MTKTRNVLAVTTFCVLLGPLTACGGSDDDPESTPLETSNAVTPGPDSVGDEDCDATVELTGAVQASWSGDGSVSARGGKVGSYSTSEDEIRLEVVPERGVFPATALVAADGVRYSTQSSAGQVTADAEGSGATVEA